MYCVHYRLRVSYRLRLLALSVAWLCAGPALLLADVVLLKNSAEPVVGNIVRQDANRIVVRVATAEGKSRDESIRRDLIDEIVLAVLPERLAKLDPARPAEYRDYAEELLARKRDPAARDLAIRLYAIAAWLDPENLGRSSLLGLQHLARSAEERKKFRAALYVIDPTMPLEPAPKAKSLNGSGETTAAQELLRALRLLRTGKGATARAIVEKPPVAKLLESYQPVMSRAEFAAAASQSLLSARELRQALLLELEMEVLAHPPTASDRAATSLDWSRELQGTGGKPVPSLSLDSLTEFDPRLCLYRDGKWVER